MPAHCFWMENELVDVYLEQISGNQLKVLIAVTRHYNKTGIAWPSIGRIGRLTGLDPKTVSKCLRQLEVLGFFEVLVIRERCKLRYVFSKTARKLLIEPNKLQEKVPSKEVVKEEEGKKSLKYESDHPDPAYRDLENEAGHPVVPR